MTALKEVFIVDGTEGKCKIICGRGDIYISILLKGPSPCLSYYINIPDFGAQPDAFKICRFKVRSRLERKSRTVKEKEKELIEQDEIER